jgi:hypothetical protein
VIGLWCVDSLLNAMALPLFIVMVGGLTGVSFADETSNESVGQPDAQQDRSECNLQHGQVLAAKPEAAS